MDASRWKVVESGLILPAAASAAPPGPPAVEHAAAVAGGLRPGGRGDLRPDLATADPAARPAPAGGSEEEKFQIARRVVTTPSGVASIGRLGQLVGSGLAAAAVASTLRRPQGAPAQLEVVRLLPAPVGGEAPPRPDPQRSGAAAQAAGTEPAAAGTGPQAARTEPQAARTDPMANAGSADPLGVFRLATTVDPEHLGLVNAALRRVRARAAGAAAAGDHRPAHAADDRRVTPVALDFARAVDAALGPTPASLHAHTVAGDGDPAPPAGPPAPPDRAHAAARRAREVAQPGTLAASDQAVRFFRDAARQDPAYLVDLARALRDRSLALARTGHVDEALSAAEDAVAIRQHLAKHDPARQLPELGDALHNLAARLTAAGRTSDGVAALEDVVAVRRHLANEHPARHLPPLAAALDDLATGLEAVDLPSARVVALEDAVAIRRHLAKCLPERFLPDLAGSLHSLALGLGALDRRHEALAAIEEAVTIRRHLSHDDPPRYLPVLAASLRALSIGLGALGQQPESLAAGEEAAQLFGRLAHHDPAAHVDDLADSLENLAIGLGAMSRHREGRAASEQAAALRRATSLALTAPASGAVPSLDPVPWSRVMPGLAVAPLLGVPTQPGPLGNDLGLDRCWCSCHTVAAAPTVDAVATTGPTPVVR